MNHGQVVGSSLFFCILASPSENFNLADGTFKDLTAKGIEFDKLSKKSKIVSDKKDEAPSLPKWQRVEGRKDAHKAFGDFMEDVRLI